MRCLFSFFTNLFSIRRRQTCNFCTCNLGWCVRTVCKRRLFPHIVCVCVRMFHSFARWLHATRRRRGKKPTTSYSCSSTCPIQTRDPSDFSSKSSSTIRQFDNKNTQIWPSSIKRAIGWDLYWHFDCFANWVRIKCSMYMQPTESPKMKHCKNIPLNLGRVSFGHFLKFYLQKTAICR